MIWEPTTEKVEQVARGEITVYRFGRENPMKLNKREFAAFEAGKEAGYLIDTSRTRYNLTNLWWNWCEAVGRPYVVVREKKKYADVCVDLLVNNETFSEEGLDALGDLFLGGALAKKSHCHRGKDRADLHHIPLEEARAMAPALVELACQPKNKEERL